MTIADDGQADDFCWGTLAACILHPLQVEIIEAFNWIDRPLTAADLLQIFDDRHQQSRIERRLRQLAKLDAVALADNASVYKRLGQRLYRLVRRPRNDR